MKRADVYNPLDKLNLAKSIELELLRRPADPLSSIDHIVGAGVYAIYYSGSFPPYRPIAEANRDGKTSWPIYVGKAIPKGGRKGGIVADGSSAGTVLAARLRVHANSIAEVSNLDLRDFSVRHLVIDDIWIPLGENMLIQSFQPVWNVALDGFGNKDAGVRRAAQFKSQWDILHPGRGAAKKHLESPVGQEFLMKRVEDFLAGRPLEKLPKPLADQEARQKDQAETLADEV
jgi:hypothetical protein